MNDYPKGWVERAEALSKGEARPGDWANLKIVKKVLSKFKKK